MVTLDRIRLTGLLPKEPRKGLFPWTCSPDLVDVSRRLPCESERPMTTTATAAETPASGSSKLAVLLAMAMFVLVFDTSLMNVSISAVVNDLDTTASGVQSAIALEALVSAAFILLSSKIGDLIGRKKAYILGLIGYAIGALSMVFAQNLTTVIICWAITGGIGASLLLPAMQSLIHGNFAGRSAEAGLRAGRRIRRHRRRRGAAPGRLHHHLSLLARRLRPRGRDHRDRPDRRQARQGRRLYGRAQDRHRRRDSVRRRDGRRRARDPHLAGGRRLGGRDDLLRAGGARRRSSSGCAGARGRGSRP